MSSFQYLLSTKRYGTLSIAFWVSYASSPEYLALTLNGPLLIEFRAQHPQTENEDRQRKENADAETDPPDGW